MTSPPSTEPTQRTGRTRSASVLKVEEVGATSQEEYLDQSAYMNMNVEWVNQKGAHTQLSCVFAVSEYTARLRRSMAYPPGAAFDGEDDTRHYPWDDTATELDVNQPFISWCKCEDLQLALAF